MRMKRARRVFIGDKGQSLVEFALVVPMLLLFILGIAELGRAWMTRNILVGAAREAARIMAVPTGNANAAKARADNILISAGITTATITLKDAPTPYDPVTVKVDYNLPIMVVGFIPGLSNSVIPLSSETSMRREH